jgi:hypothetical protein
MSVVELERRGQKNPCFCDACRDVEGARKRAEKGEKEERDVVEMEMEMIAAKSTHSGTNFNTRGRVLVSD